MRSNSDQKKKYKILLFLFAIGPIASIILHSPWLTELCGGSNSGCTAVENSGYKQTLGVENSLLGIITFVILIAITLSQILTPHKNKELIINLGTIAIAIAGVYFISLQFVIIKATCRYCMVVDLISIASLGVYFRYR